MAQTLYTGADAAYPGNPLPAGTQILAAYIGIPGAHGPDTPHIWTAAEWNSYLEADPSLRVLPIYVHNYPDADPGADADNAADAALRLGWAPNLPGSSRRIIALDLETMVDPSWVQAFCDRAWFRGFRVMPYGSGSTVTRNPPGTGYWEAIWTGRRPAVLGPRQLGQQYYNGPVWDLDVFAQDAYDGCGHGLRWPKP